MQHSSLFTSDHFAVMGGERGCSCVRCVSWPAGVSFAFTPPVKMDPQYAPRPENNELPKTILLYKQQSKSTHTLKLAKVGIFSLQYVQRHQYVFGAYHLLLVVFLQSERTASMRFVYYLRPSSLRLPVLKLLSLLNLYLRFAHKLHGFPISCPKLESTWG